MRELFRFLTRGQSVLAGCSLAPDLAALRRLALWLAAAGTAVLVLGLAGGWWVATRAVQRIRGYPTRRRRYLHRPTAAEAKPS